MSVEREVTTLRFWVLVAVMFAAVACDASTTTGPAPTSTRRPTTTGTPLRRFSSGGLSFDYPAVWLDAHYDMYFTFSNLITYLGTMPMHNPCTTTSQNGGVIENCTDPIAALEPGAVLVRWHALARPLRPGQPEISAPNTAIAGQIASLKVDKPGTCITLGADETITADIARPGSADNFYEVTACLRTPGVADNERLVMDMLASAHITS